MDIINDAILSGSNNIENLDINRYLRAFIRLLYVRTRELYNVLYNDIIVNNLYDIPKDIALKIFQYNELDFNLNYDNVLFKLTHNMFNNEITEMLNSNFMKLYKIYCDITTLITGQPIESIDYNTFLNELIANFVFIDIDIVLNKQLEIDTRSNNVILLQEYLNKNQANPNFVKIQRFLNSYKRDLMYRMWLLNNFISIIKQIISVVPNDG